jgi:hypothetical protein
MWHVGTSGETSAGGRGRLQVQVLVVVGKDSTA